MDEEYAARLAALETPLPPILVRRSDMTVIDGRHRPPAGAAARPGANRGRVLRGLRRRRLPPRRRGQRDTRPAPVARRPAGRGRPHHRLAPAPVHAGHRPRLGAEREGRGGAPPVFNRCRAAVGQARRPGRPGPAGERDGGPLAGGPGDGREPERVAARDRPPRGHLPATASDVRKRILAGEPPVAGPCGRTRPAPPNRRRPG
ncbi:hypothetical protein LT493_23525 [Streptomyces tricolor]|nr:hypothetical protein [Streptomyces tricolor]